ncbi:hypothetical protein ACJMK2_021925 [Sinanodonta woodiana]|uniref:Transmembrane protein 245 n=1 Tax=Sinanodonta woodiana TaxID=1069815 RepID=A0ABD3THH5_SINWO
MAATPVTPLNLLNIVPKEHEKAIKQAFYNTAANIFVLLACATAVAVYFILEAFLRPLLWAVLCGAFLNPFKRNLTYCIRKWLQNLKDTRTPLFVGIVVTPLKCLDNVSDFIGNTFVQHLKHIILGGTGVVLLYLLWNFGPLQGILFTVQTLIIFTYNVLEYFSSAWIWAILLGYALAVIFLWNSVSRAHLHCLSVLVWLTLILHVANIAGPLRVPLLICLVMVVTVGFVAEVNEARKQREDKNASFVCVAWSLISGTDRSPKEMVPSEHQTDLSGESSVQDVANEGSIQTTEKPKHTHILSETMSLSPSKPSTLPIQISLSQSLQSDPGKTKKSKQSTDVPRCGKQKSLSDQCFIALFWALVLTRIWMHIWLVFLILPLPVGIWIIKNLGYKLGRSEGLLGERIQAVKADLLSWFQDRYEILMPRWLHGLVNLVITGDKKIICVLEQSLDKVTSVLFILLLLFGTTLISVIAAIQIQQESMYLVSTTSNLLNETLHPEISQWLPNSDVMQTAVDSMVGNAYLYGRNWIAGKVRDLVNGESDNNTQIETKVLEIWDGLYDSWLARNATSTTSLARPGFQMVPFDLTNLTSIWEYLSKGNGINISGVVEFVKENIETFLSVLESIWLVLKGNMNLVLSVLTSVLSLVFGGGTALLNFVLSSSIFLTTLFYLLASSGDQYKPIDWFASMSPTTGGNTFGQAVQDAVGGVFMASLKMTAFYGLYTWLTHTIFGVNIVFIPSAVAAIFAAVPFLGTYLAAVPAALELWLVQGQGLLAVLLMICHLLPTSVVDTAIYSEIKGGHPYMTGLAIAGGMYWMGLEGAIFGPIILCCLVVLVNVYSSMIQPDTTPSSFSRSQSMNI